MSQRAWLAAAAVCAALARPAGAEPGTAGAVPFEDPTVSAPRVEKRLGEVPAAVSVVGEREIQQARPQVSLDEPLAGVPGVFTENRTNAAQDLRLSIRGFGARSTFGIRGVRVLVDGIPATLPDGQTQLDHVDLGSTERIEVIRGPSSSLYGPSAGGVLRIESQRGDATPDAYSRVAFGSHGYRRYQGRAGGSYRDARALVSLSRLELGGYRDHAATENILFNSNFGWAPDASSDLSLSVNVVHAPTADDPGGLTAAELAEDRRRAAPGNRLFDAGESVDQQQFGLVYRRDFGEHHGIEASNYYLWRQFDNRLPFRDGGSVDLDRFFGGGGLRYVYADRFWERDNRLMLGFEIDAQRDVRKRYDNEEGRRGALVFDQDENVTNYGVYVQDELAILPNLEVTAGVRYDRVDFSVDDGFPADGADGGHLAFDAVSPRAAVHYALHPAINLYANVSTSFETPTTTELANPDGSGGFNHDLDAQTALSYELGVKGGRPGVFWYEVVGYYIDVDDELVPYEVAGMPGRDFFENAARSTRAGLEIAVALQPLPGLSASLSYTFSHFEFDRFRSDEGNYDGLRIPGVPRNQIWAELAYHHPTGLYGAWEFRWVDDLWADNANTVKSEAYLVSNLRLGYVGRFGGWEVGPFVGFDNLFGAKYNDNVRLNASFGRSFEPAPVFEVYGGLSLAYHFRAL